MNRICIGIFCIGLLMMFVCIAGCAPEGGKPPVFVPVEPEESAGSGTAAKKEMYQIPAAFEIKIAEKEEGKDAGMRTAFDILYKERERSDPKLTSLDLYAPRAGSTFPTLVFIHGGAWSKGDKRGLGSAKGKAEWFTSKGYIFVSLNYRLTPQVDFNGQAADVACGLSWIHSHIDKFGGDPKRIFLMGHSAGAHLAALVSVEPKYLEKEGEKLSLIKGTTLLDGAGYDIPMQVNLIGGALSKRLYTNVFGRDEKTWKEASPTYRVRKGISIVPFLIFHAGARAASEFQALGLAKKLKSAGVKASVIHAPRKTHLTINREIGKADDEVTAKIMDFMQGNR